MNRTDLQQLATTRLDEAQVLLQAGRFSGAYYLAGYAVECALKAVIAKATQQYDFPDRQRVMNAHTHNLQMLVKLAGLDDERKRISNDYPAFAVNWEIVVAWSETSRYQIWPDFEATSLVLATTDLNAGVFPWLSIHW